MACKATGKDWRGLAKGPDYDGGKVHAALERVVLFRLCLLHELG